MPPRVAGVQDRTPAMWFNSLPPLTRSLLCVYLVTGIGTLLGIMPLKYLYLDWSLVSPWMLRFKRVPQVWRLLGNFTFIGKPSMAYLFQLIWLVRYGGALEASDFQHNTADGVYMLLIGMLATLAFDLVIPFFRGFFHGSSLIFMLLYIWSKRNPNAPVSIFGIMQLQGLHLPFAFLVIDLMVQGDWKGDLLGILSGHVYYFLRDVYPLSSGRNVIQTPAWLVRVVHRWGIGRVPIRQLNPANPADPGFRPFAGRGRRLAD